MRTNTQKITPQSRWSAAAIRELRGSMGLIQEDFAALVGVRAQTVSQWEGGHQHPDRRSLKTLDALAGGEE